MERRFKNVFGGCLKVTCATLPSPYDGNQVAAMLTDHYTY